MTSGTSVIQANSESLGRVINDGTNISSQTSHRHNDDSESTARVRFCPLRLEIYINLELSRSVQLNLRPLIRCFLVLRPRTALIAYLVTVKKKDIIAFFCISFRSHYEKTDKASIGYTLVSTAIDKYLPRAANREPTRS